MFWVQVLKNYNSIFLYWHTLNSVTSDLKRLSEILADIPARLLRYFGEFDNNYILSDTFLPNTP